MTGDTSRQADERPTASRRPGGGYVATARVPPPYPGVERAFGYYHWRPSSTMNGSNCGAAVDLVESRRHFRCRHCGCFQFPDPDPLTALLALLRRG